MTAMQPTQPPPAGTGPVQGTVASFEMATGSGTVLLDDGTELAFPATAFELSGLRLLRVGQRLRLVRDQSGAVTEVSLITLG